MFYFNMLLLTTIVVFIVDVSNFVQEVKPEINIALKRHPESRLKPFDCSTCMVFWTGVIYALFAGFSIPRLAFVCLCAFGAQFFAGLIFIIWDAIQALIDSLNTKLEKK